VSLPLWNLIFVTHPLTLVVAISQGKAHHPHPVLEVFFCILPKDLSFYFCCSPSWSILLVRKPGRCLTSLTPGGVSHTFAPLPKPERHTFTLDRVTRGSLGGDHSPLLPPTGRIIIQNCVLTSVVGGAPNWFPSLLQVPLLSGVPGEASPSIGSTGPLVPGGTLF
jgi:hypothetical protein